MTQHSASVEQPVRTSSGLLRVLGTAFGLALAIGGMVGSGIFRTPGAIVSNAGTLWIAALLLLAGGIQTLLSANIWAEVSTAIPLSGGTVVVVRRAFGDTAALITGWTDALASVASSAQLSVAGAGFLAAILPGLTPYPGLTAAALTILVALINWRGVVMGEAAQMVASVAKAVVIIGLVVLLFRMTPLATSAPAAAPDRAITIGTMLIGYQLVYGAYAGWSLPGYFAEETTDPGRAIPRALFWSVVGVTGLYLLMLVALAHVLPLTLLSGADFPAGIALANVLGPTSGVVLAFIALVTVLSCQNANVMPGTRIMLATARAGYAPRSLTHVNDGGTPEVALLVFTLLCVGLALTGRYELVFILMGTLNMALTAISDLAYFQLRRREPTLTRPFRAIGHPWLPLLALLLDLGILLAVAIADPWGAIYALIAIVIGVVAARLSRKSRTEMPIGAAA
ncbi:APC family permease [Sphingomonas sp. AR_OL41]|uniref:APC family permease n=1 Tax=Sphingomonas sp. AR_OL41 TaxID=3042729 RepID=UPI002480CBA9|nr:APC family permease [Sphingomonas sp. AR_OL41]MDH7974998.1 APC family permease [Sphingomonas sp. AR_OL41]